MGLISRKIFPACESMFICCPALRTSSRQPIKCYKKDKLLAKIFRKSIKDASNEENIKKLCEYAANNPIHIPKIAEHLEEKFKQIKFISIVTEAYNKLLCICKDQMAYFALSLLSVVTELLDNSKQDLLQVLGCQTLTRFIYSQADGTYAYNIEKLVHKICEVARGTENSHQNSCLRASSLQCVTAMVWFMAQFSLIFAEYDEIVKVTLDNYDPAIHNENDDERGAPHHNWVDEVVRCEGRVGGNAMSPRSIMFRPRPEKKDPTQLTREEIETPKVWAQISIQRMVELAKESMTMRRILDSMFTYFDTRRHWDPQQGLALVVVSDMSYFVESVEYQQLILAAVIRHLDHKNVSLDLKIKSHVIHVATALVRQIKSGEVLAEIGCFSDLCRHLKKSLQATIASIVEEELNLNITLQNAIEDCLVEIIKRTGDARPLFDMMALNLEKLPSDGHVARATLESLLIVAHIISLASALMRSQQVFPEALLVQLLQLMFHPDNGARIVAHQIFSALLFSSPNNISNDVTFMQSGYLYKRRRWQSNTTSAFTSITHLLEKLRREKDGARVEKHGFTVEHSDSKGRDIIEEDWKQGQNRKNTPSLYNISSVIDKTAGSRSLAEAEPCILKLSDDQIGLLLSAFWMQASLPDNMPSNFESIAHSFSLTLMSARLKNPNDNLMPQFFQLPLSLRNISLDPTTGTLTPACQRSLFTLSSNMLMFAAKMYQIPHISNFLKSFVSHDVDPYIGISDELQVYVKPKADVKGYGSAADMELAESLLNELRSKMNESDKLIVNIIVQNLSNVTKLDADELFRQLADGFTPDDGLQSFLYSDQNYMISHSNESLSFDGDFQSSLLVEDDAVSESSVSDISRSNPNAPVSPSTSRIISVEQLMESALEVAGQVAGTSVSTSPLPYCAMARQCEAFESGTRQKLSNWLVHENNYSRLADKIFQTFPEDGHPPYMKASASDGMPAGRNALPMDSWLAMKLPPASPFDNFLRAAQYQMP